MSNSYSYLVTKTNKDKFSPIKNEYKTMDLHYLSSVEIEHHFKRSMVN